MNKADRKMGFYREVKTDKPCVFISHKKEDQKIAIMLGEFIESKFQYDIYLDIFDCELQEAVSINNDKKIVDSIKAGVDLSDILLCVISDETRLSWWVPYEIGLADNKGLTIASIKTKEVNDIPSFLKTQESLASISDLLAFLLKNGRYGGMFFKQETVELMRKGDVGNLEKYFI